jgi:hypothetical protein
VFTARYALSPYIKQIRFVFKGLIIKNWILIIIILLLLLLLRACLYAVIISCNMSFMGSLDGSVSVVTSLRTGLSGERGFSILRNVQTVGVHWTSYLMCTAVSFPGDTAAGGVRQLNKLYLMPKLRLSGAVSPLFMMCIRTTSPLPFRYLERLVLHLHRTDFCLEWLRDEILL